MFAFFYCLENGFIIDNIPIPSVSHFQQADGRSNGPVGLINSDMVENLDFFRVNSVLSDARLTVTLSVWTSRTIPSNLAPSLDVNV